MVIVFRHINKIISFLVVFIYFLLLLTFLFSVRVVVDFIDRIVGLLIAAFCFRFADCFGHFAIWPLPAFQLIFIKLSTLSATLRHSGPLHNAPPSPYLLGRRYPSADSCKDTAILLQRIREVN